jgi:hypothetical protein
MVFVEARGVTYADLQGLAGLGIASGGRGRRRL